MPYRWGRWSSLDRGGVLDIFRGGVTLGNEVWFWPEAEGQGLAAVAASLAQAMGGASVALEVGVGGGPWPCTRACQWPEVGLTGPEVAAALAHLMEQVRPQALLVPASPLGEEVAARVAASLRLGLLAQCSRLEVGQAGELQALRPAYGRRASCLLLGPQGETVVASFCLEALRGREAVGERGPTTTIRGEPPAPAPCPEVAQEWHLGPEAMEVTEADVVVAGGRGMGGPEGFRLLWELASYIGGTVAASRPAVDAGWASKDRQIGSSGHAIAPRLYIACGISGASQHLVGMQGAQEVVAINNDPGAPIFALAQLGLVGDARQVLEAALTRLRQRPLPPFGGPHVPSGGRGAQVMVCLATGPDPESPLDCRRVDKASRTIGPADAAALALGVRLKANTGKVWAVIVGEDAGAEETLRLALALGADEALWVRDLSREADVLATALALAQVAYRLQAQLVVCGERSIQGETGAVPYQLSQLLGWPCIAHVLEAAVDHGQLWALRWQAGGRRALVRCGLPAVLAIRPGAATLPYPSLRERMRVATRPIAQWSVHELGLAEEGAGRVKVLRLGLPKPISLGPYVVKESPSPWERLLPLLGGGRPAAGLVTGPPEALAQRLLDFLAQRHLLPAG
jgi:electron transfer flavoprotein alpha subunit